MGGSCSIQNIEVEISKSDSSSDFEPLELLELYQPKKKTEKYESSWSRVESEHDDMTQKRFGQIFKKNRESPNLSWSKLPFETQSR